MATLKETLEQNVREGELWERIADPAGAGRRAPARAGESARPVAHGQQDAGDTARGRSFTPGTAAQGKPEAGDAGAWLKCYACGHECAIPDGQAGVCKVRFNRGGTLYVPWGYAAGVQCDPIEKKPFHHAWPGGLAYSFGMLGCDLHCAYCQNWVTSQALRDSKAVSRPMRATPQEMVREAVELGARAMVSTYNEPLITAEWAVAVFREAKQAGLATGFVSNGNATPQALEYLRPWVDLYKVDLKSFDDRQYRQLGGRLEPILRTIRGLVEMGFWVEVVTLVVPGFNDSDDELRRMAEFLASVSPLVPWHVTAFHKDYKMTGPENTPPETLLRAAEIGRAAGLKYVYAGNLPGRVGDLENTRCHGCGETLVERHGYLITGYHLTSATSRRSGASSAEEGRPEAGDTTAACPRCATAIPGRWGAKYEGQISEAPFRVWNRR